MEFFFSGVNNDKCSGRRDNNHPNGMKKRAKKFPAEGEKEEDEEEERFHLPDGIREANPRRRNNRQVMLQNSLDKKRILSRGNDFFTHQ